MRFVWLPLVAVVPALLAQAPAPAVPSPDLLGIAHVALRVSNLQTSLAFYKSLGFTDAFNLSRDGAVYEAFVKINDRQFIELYPASDKDPQVGFLHLCFEGGNLQAVHDFYVSEGLHPIDVRKAGAGNLLFTMPGPLTPSGPQNMEYTEYLPGSLHSRDFGQHLPTDPVSRELSGVTVAVEDLPAAESFYHDKLQFTEAGTAGTDTFVVRGSTHGQHSQTVTLVRADMLGHRARISFRASQPEAERYLRTHHIPFTKQGNGLRVTDPDGNQLVLTP